MKTHTQSLFTVLAVLASIHQSVAQSNAWSQLFPAGGPPEARSGSTAVLNTSNGRMIVFGGAVYPNIFFYGGSYLFEINDVWIFQDARTNTGNTWQSLSISGPLPFPRCNASAVYDQADNRMMIFGGNTNLSNCGGDVNEVWVLTNADGTGGAAGWTLLSPTGTPPSIRSAASTVYDPASNEMIVYGGNEQCSAVDGDLWMLSNANGLGGTPAWTQLNPVGGPGPRTGHSAVYDAANNRMVLFGGVNNTGYTNDVWLLSNANGSGGAPTWSQLNPTNSLPPPRSGFAATYDSSLNALVIFGGASVSGITNDSWVLSHANGLGGTPAWTPLTTTSSLPGPRNFCSGVLVPGANRLVIFGGTANSNFNDVWALQYLTLPLPPALGIASAGSQTTLYWPASATNVVLQSTTNLSSPSWTTVSNGTPIVGLTVTNASPAAFFRLQSQ